MNDETSIIATAAAKLEQALRDSPPLDENELGEAVTEAVVRWTAGTEREVRRAHYLNAIGRLASVRL